VIVCRVPVGAWSTLRRIQGPLQLAHAELAVVRRQTKAPVVTPLPPRAHCGHRRHGKSVVLACTTEFSVNRIRVAESPDGFCVQWCAFPEELDQAAWAIFSTDLLGEARTRLEARVTPRPRKNFPPRRRRWAAA